MKKNIYYEYFVVALETVFLTLLVLLAVSPVSCRMSEGGIKIIASDYDCPRLENFSVLNERSLRLSFSKSVTVKDVLLYPEVNFSSASYEYPSSRDGACFVNLQFASPLSTGASYSLFARAKDTHGNSLTFSVPFSGYNSNVAELEMIEIHPKYQGESKGNGSFKNEYVLFLVKESGNLSALKFLSASDGIDKAYTFPSVEVKKGEKLCLHLRNKGEGCVSETEEDISLSKAYYSKNDVRDLWEENENARLNDESDVLLLINSQNDTVVDAALYAPSSKESWKNTILEEAAKRAFESGVWKGGYSVKYAFSSDGITASKAFVKSEENSSTQAEESRKLWTVGISSLK